MVMNNKHILLFQMTFDCLGIVSILIELEQPSCKCEIGFRFLPFRGKHNMTMINMQWHEFVILLNLNGKIEPDFLNV